VRRRNDVSRRRTSVWMPVGVGLLLTCLAGTALTAGRASGSTARETFSVDYVVNIDDHDRSVARVRWDFAGIDEINGLTLRFPATRFRDFDATGTLTAVPGGLKWVPNGPYAHLAYRVTIDHVRGQHQRYDSYVGPNWIVTRARTLFPRVDVDWSARDGATPKSRARLQFRLPAGWRSAAALESLAPLTFQLAQPGMVLDRPRGWFALGEFRTDHADIDGTQLQVVRMPGSTLDTQALFGFLEPTLPALQRLLATTAPRLLLVSAPDPMWHGGISGERSFYMHAGRPLRTPDHTSPYLHELFHVLQSFTPAADADWIEEGLAEYYSLELQRRAGLVDAAAFARALGYFQRYGLWNVNLTQQHDNAATNNSAPLVMYALDQRIQRATAGKARLDDVVHVLVRAGGSVDTRRFADATTAVSGKAFPKFFERYVVQGTPVALSDAVDR
jgi:hypothetical protein